MKVLVGLSGGVDSTATAIQLIKQGHEVEGALMTLYKDEYNFTGGGGKGTCFGPGCDDKKIKEAQAISDKLGIKLHIIDVSNNYENIVLDNFRSEYLDGKTPNPCVWCNTYIKFGAFIDSAKSSGITFDKFATGHYSQIEYINNRYALKKGKHLAKDQTYFLYRLSQEQLSNIIFPMGDKEKEDARRITTEYGIDFSQVKESQDFYSGSYSELLDATPIKGNIETLDGKVVGEHNGIFNYTIGQRRGLPGGFSKPIYVIRLDIKRNAVIVGYKEQSYSKAIDIINVVYGKVASFKTGDKAFAKIRSASRETPVTLEYINDDRIRVHFDNEQQGVTPGQSLVLYKDDYVLGGGIMSLILN